MPTEKTIVARNAEGDGIYFNQSSIPSPQVVEVYERYCDGAAKMLLEMASAEQTELFRLQDRKANHHTLGMWFGFILSIVLVGSFTFLMYTGHWVAGAASILMALISLASTFAFGSKPQPK